MSLSPSVSLGVNSMSLLYLPRHFGSQTCHSSPPVSYEVCTEGKAYSKTLGSCWMTEGRTRRQGLRWSPVSMLWRWGSEARSVRTRSCTAQPGSASVPVAPCTPQLGYEDMDWEDTEVGEQRDYVAPKLGRPWRLGEAGLHGWGCNSEGTARAEGRRSQVLTLGSAGSVGRKGVSQITALETHMSYHEL